MGGCLFKKNNVKQVVLENNQYQLFFSLIRLKMMLRKSLYVMLKTSAYIILGNIPYPSV